MWIASAQNSRRPRHTPVVEHDEEMPTICYENCLKRIDLYSNNNSYCFTTALHGIALVSVVTRPLRDSFSTSLVPAEQQSGRKWQVL